MSTITLWLLISLPGYAGSNSNVPTTLVERFASATECERVRNIIKGSQGRQELRCIEATVVKGTPQ